MTSFAGYNFETCNILDASGNPLQTVDISFDYLDELYNRTLAQKNPFPKAPPIFHTLSDVVIYKALTNATSPLGNYKSTFKNMYVNTLLSNYQSGFSANQWYKIEYTTVLTLMFTMGSEEKNLISKGLTFQSSITNTMHSMVKFFSWSGPTSLLEAALMSTPPSLTSLLSRMQTAEDTIVQLLARVRRLETNTGIDTTQDTAPSLNSLVTTNINDIIQLKASKADQTDLDSTNVEVSKRALKTELSAEISRIDMLYTNTGVTPTIMQKSLQVQIGDTNVEVSKSALKTELTAEVSRIDMLYTNTGVAPTTMQKSLQTQINDITASTDPRVDQLLTEVGRLFTGTGLSKTIDHTPSILSAITTLDLVKEEKTDHDNDMLLKADVTALALKEDKTDHTADLALKADKSELALKADKTDLNLKEDKTTHAADMASKANQTSLDATNSNVATIIANTGVDMNPNLPQTNTLQARITDLEDSSTDSADISAIKAQICFQSLNPLTGVLEPPKTICQRVTDLELSTISGTSDEPGWSHDELSQELIISGIDAWPLRMTFTDQTYVPNIMTLNSFMLAQGHDEGMTLNNIITFRVLASSPQTLHIARTRADGYVEDSCSQPARKSYDPLVLLKMYNLAFKKALRITREQTGNNMANSRFNS